MPVTLSWARVSASRGVRALVVPWLTSHTNEKIKPTAPSHRVTESRSVVSSRVAGARAYWRISIPDGAANLSRYSMPSDGIQKLSENSCSFIK